MPGWTKYCDTAPASFIMDQWEKWPDAGICVTHGNIIGLDVDTDREDVQRVVAQAIVPSDVKRRGAKGYMGYYRPGSGLEGFTARVRWYDKEDVVCEILLHGTQSVLPPTIHPTTNKPYHWLSDDTLENTNISELPELTGEDISKLDEEFAKLGLSRKAPRRAKTNDYERARVTDHDLEKPLGRSVNDRALEPDAIDEWWPKLDMPKTRQRGRGSWEAVPFWRVSSSGRLISERNPNLKIVPNGIVDFGADRSYTPIDVIISARDCSFDAAVEWLAQYVRVEKIEHMEITAPEPEVKPSPPKIEDANFNARWMAAPVFHGTRSYQKIKPVVVPSDAEYEALIPSEPQPFPIANFGADCPGLLGQVATYLDEASATATEAGSLAIALPLLGAIMGRAYATPTDLRTNIYSGLHLTYSRFN